MASKNNATWYKIAENIEEINFSSNGLAELQLNGKTLCIGLFNKQIFACAQKCPHAGGIMANGYIDALGQLVCPLHRYKFNPNTGKNLSGEGYYLKTYLIATREDGVFIRFTNP